MLETGLRRVEAVFNLFFTERWNPWYELGALAFFFFWIVTVSGIYLFIFSIPAIPAPTSRLSGSRGISGSWVG